VVAFRYDRRLGWDVAFLGYDPRLGWDVAPSLNISMGTWALPPGRALSVVARGLSEQDRVRTAHLYPFRDVQNLGQGLKYQGFIQISSSGRITSIRDPAVPHKVFLYATSDSIPRDFRNMKTCQIVVKPVTPFDEGHIVVHDEVKVTSPFIRR